MTVCLAALCRNGDSPRAVVAADRMVTLGGFMELEHARPKMAEASSYAVAMVAGSEADVLLAPDASVRLALAELELLRVQTATMLPPGLAQDEPAAIRDLSPFGR